PLGIAATEAGSLGMFGAPTPGVVRMGLIGASKQYRPRPGDIVLGTIKDRYGDFCLVDLGAGEWRAGRLSAGDFDTDAIKAIRGLNPGDILLCRIKAYPKATDSLSTPMLSASAPGLGLKKGGRMVSNVSSGLCRRLMHPSSPLLAALAKHLTFQIAAGHNNRLWVTSTSAENTALILRLLLDPKTDARSIRKAFKKDDDE
ncbi:exosome complex RNA-binding protein 1/RRP40/RRP4, partial [Kipferlia bialata]